MKNKMSYFLIAAIVLVSCKDLKKSIDDTLSDPKPITNNSVNISTTSYTENNHRFDTNEKDESVPFTSQQNQLEKAEKELRELPQFQGKSIFIYNVIHFYEDGRIITKLQNPENPTYVDEYNYKNGFWLPPTPVVLTKFDNVKRNLVNLDKLPFKNVFQVYKVLEEKRKEIDDKSPDYTIYAIIKDNKIRWRSGSVGNERSKYDIEYNEDGTLKSFEQQ